MTHATPPFNNNLNNRFLINISCWNLPPQLKNELDNFLYNDIISRTNLGNKKEVDNWLLKQNIHIPQTAVFIRYLYINNNESIIFDLEKFQFINKHGESVENIPKVFILTNNLDIKSKLNIAAYDTIKPDKELQIITNTITYGKVTINLMKYNNPQIRNAYNILTEIPITSYNSRGALLGNQKISNILIDDLDNINKINKFVLKCNLNINELFIDKNGILKWEKF